ncbi:hypothetical protein WMF15_46180 [Sorangium sp. So ce233]
MPRARERACDAIRRLRSRTSTVAAVALIQTSSCTCTYWTE